MWRGLLRWTGVVVVLLFALGCGGGGSQSTPVDPVPPPVEPPDSGGDTGEPQDPVDPGDGSEDPPEEPPPEEPPGDDHGGDTPPAGSDPVLPDPEPDDAGAWYPNFESPQVAPLRLSPDGSRLFAANTAAGRLSVFSLADPRQPVRIAEIPVGIDPVSVLPLSNDEVWVVNHVSGTISVVSVSRGVVVDTLIAGTEPADIVLINGMVVVSVSRERALWLFDPSERVRKGSLPLVGEAPRSMVVSPDGNRLYVAFALGGNGTTLMPLRANPPSPEHSMEIEGLPPGPQVGMIIDSRDEALNGFMNFSLADHDVAEIDVDTGTVRYLRRAGTVNLALALDPAGEFLYLAGTEAHNLTFFQPNLRGRFVDNRITRFQLDSDERELILLDREVDPATLPDALAREQALAQPAAMVFHPDGQSFWLAAFGSDRLAKLSANGEVLLRVDIRIDADTVRGPRALAMSAGGDYLYVQNRIANSLMVLDVEAGTVISEQPVGSHELEPAFVREGRGLLYDARLSGSGAHSCASCHVDGGTDNLAWNLGDPTASMRYVQDPESGEWLSMHPLKGPLVTQPLSGLHGHKAFHWRGDLPALQSFNALFPNLMAAPPLADPEIDKLAAFMNSIAMLPNPNLRLDGSLPATLGGYSPATGVSSFESQCSSCHSLPGRQPLKYILRPNGTHLMVSSLRRFYRKDGYRNAPGAVSTIGFGVLKDGSEAPELSADIFAFMFSWDTGTALTVGHAVTLDASNFADSLLQQRWQTLQTRSGEDANALLVHGELDGAASAWEYLPEQQQYRRCGGDQLVTLDWFLDRLEAGSSTLTAQGLPVGAGSCQRFVGITP